MLRKANPQKIARKGTFLSLAFSMHPICALSTHPETETVIFSNLFDNNGRLKKNAPMLLATWLADPQQNAWSERWMDQTPLQ